LGQVYERLGAEVTVYSNTWNRISSGWMEALSKEFLESNEEAKGEKLIYHA